MRKKNKELKKKKHNHLLAAFIFMSLSICAAAAVLIFLPRQEQTWTKPEELLITYMEYVQNHNYEAMYAMLAEEAASHISREDFIKRNSAIYEGMDTQNMKITILSCDKERNSIKYNNSFDTLAGSVSFDNEAWFVKGDEGYKLLWKDSLSR